VAELEVALTAAALDDGCLSFERLSSDVVLTHMFRGLGGFGGLAGSAVDVCLEGSVASVWTEGDCVALWRFGGGITVFESIIP